MPQRKPALLGAVAAFALAALAFTAVALQAGSNSGAGPVSPRAAAVAWRGLVDEPRVPVAVGERMLVVLDLPSLADRVAASGGRAGDRQERRWTASALSLQRLFLSRLTVQGAQIKPEFRYGRVLNGFSAQLDPRSLALLERAPEVEGIYPVRAAYPASVEEDRAARAAFSAGIGARPEGGLPGFDGRGVAIALLDTGVDRLHPYLRGRLLEGIDVVGGSELAAAASRPEDPTQVERHGTQLAGIMVGAGGPPGLAGIATGASVIPIRIAGWQRDAQGGWAVYSRTDQIIAGLERAVDPNDDGDAHDAARIALVGVAEPYAAFAQGALAQAAGGALRLDTLVVGPAGNDGPAGPGFGSVSGPGGAPAALTVAAGDLRPSFQIARVVLRAGLRVVLDRTLPLAGAVGPERPLDLPIATPRLSGERVLPAPGTPSVSAADFFDARGYSRVAASGGRAGDRQERRWTASALSLQR
ncbi:MAG: S8 family serine peptidase, partial [Actinobacteria bacterium]|nr:S8 family serine peptidase [Actinomycetota bacterium]